MTADRLDEYAYPNGDPQGHEGITKREYFALTILQGLAAVPDFEVEREGQKKYAVKKAVDLAEALADELDTRI